MPQRLKLVDGRRVWNLTGAAVGIGWAATRTDVKMVQYLLNVTSDYFVKTGRLTSPFGLSVDGICGPKTASAVKTSEAKFKGNGAQDGRVSKIQGTTGFYDASHIYVLFKIETAYTQECFGIYDTTSIITPGMFNEAMDFLPFDPALDSEVRGELIKQL